MMTPEQAIGFQTILTVGLPSLAVLTGILVNNTHLGELRGTIDTLRTDMNRQFDAINKRLDRIEGKLDSHEQRITIIEERTNPLRGGVR